jgi:glycosyltransferase involved in cell wall biosynthesis
MADPFFSVVIPAYNRESFIGSAIDSVLAQTFKDFEVLVVDDASIDRTVEVVEAFSDQRVQLVRQQKNMERGAARNAGVATARGRYICYLDSDDRFLPEHLSNFYRYIVADNFEDKLWFSNTYLETAKGIFERPQPDLQEDKKFGYLLRYTFSPCRVCVSRKIALEFPFDETIPGIEDMDNWLHIATKYPLVQLEEYTAVYVEHDDSYTTGDVKRFAKELRFFVQVFKKPRIGSRLPGKEKRYLLSKCHYHLAIGAFQSKNRWSTLNHCIKAFYFYPSGYNQKANKTMLVMVIYSLPIIGNLIRIIRKIFR